MNTTDNLAGQAEDRELDVFMNLLLRDLQQTNAISHLLRSSSQACVPVERRAGSEDRTSICPVASG
jgi:hypothetical protein